MLVHAGQVKLKRNLDFLPSSRTQGHVLEAPVAAACRSSSREPALAGKLIALSQKISSKTPVHTIPE